MDRRRAGVRGSCSGLRPLARPEWHLARQLRDRPDRVGFGDLDSRKSWATYPTTALYTVLLAGALAALATGVYSLGLEMSVYGWDMKASQGKQLQAAGRTAAAPFAGPPPVQHPAEKRK